MGAPEVAEDAQEDVQANVHIHADLDAQHQQKHRKEEEKGLVRLAEPAVQPVARQRRRGIAADAELVAHITAARYVREHAQMCAGILARRHAKLTARFIARQNARWTAQPAVLFPAVILAIMAADLSVGHRVRQTVLEIAAGIVEVHVAIIAPDALETAPDIALDATTTALHLAHSLALDVQGAAHAEHHAGQDATIHVKQPAKTAVLICARANAADAVLAARTIAQIIVEKPVPELAMEQHRHQCIKEIKERKNETNT